MLKASDKKTGAAVQVPVSYEENDQPTPGIAFWRKNGAQRYIPYSFLTAVDFDGGGELIFHFMHWRAHVRGEALKRLWEAAQEGRLARVRELDKSPGIAEPWVRELIFADLDAEPSLTTPRFPENSEGVD